MVYMIRQEVRNGSLFKVGFSANFEQRKQAYTGYVPTFEIIDTVKTYAKTKRHLEKMIHSEIREYGFEFVNSTEWFFVPIELENDVKTAGLKLFKACKNRKTTNSPTAQSRWWLQGRRKVKVDY